MSTSAPLAHIFIATGGVGLAHKRSLHCQVHLSSILFRLCILGMSQETDNQRLTIFSTFTNRASIRQTLSISVISVIIAEFLSFLGAKLYRRTLLAFLPQHSAEFY